MPRSRAHADRGEYIRTAVGEVPVQLKRLAARFRRNRQRLPQAGACA